MWPIENQARSLKSVRKLRGSNTQSSEPNLRKISAELGEVGEQRM